MIRPPRLTLDCFAELLHRYVDLVQPEWIDLRRNMDRVQHTRRDLQEAQEAHFRPPSANKKEQASRDLPRWTPSRSTAPSESSPSPRQSASSTRSPRSKRTLPVRRRRRSSLSLLCPNSPGGRSTSLRCLHPVRRRFQGRQKNRACG